MLLYSPVAVILLSLTRTVKFVDNELLRTSLGCNNLSPSLTLYVDWLKLTFNEPAKSLQEVKRISNTIVYKTLSLLFRYLAIYIVKTYSAYSYIQIPT